MPLPRPAAKVTDAGPVNGPERPLFAISTLGLATGGILYLFGGRGAAHAVWAAVAVVGLASALWWVIEATRQHRLGVDVIALLALLGTLLVGEYLAGAVIAVMLASGRVLESWAEGRARRELRLLLDRAPRTAHRSRDELISDVAVGEVRVGDLLVVKPGEVVPVDGLVVEEVAVIDESALTGESQPVERGAGDAVRSGTVNAGGPFRLQTTTTAQDSTYAGIVRLVSTVEAASAPSVRLADRYAGVFLVVSLAVAGGAWLLSGHATRAVAVLVVATPCPLILAVPVAMVSGLSRSARRGVVIKGGAVLERLAAVRVLLFDKTGTLTMGRPTVAATVALGGLEAEELIRLAASVDQLSPHVLAAAVVRAARERGLSLQAPTDMAEEPGRGVHGVVEGRLVSVGKAAWVAPSAEPGWARAIKRRADREGMLTVFVAVDGEPAGALLLDDPVRPDAARTIRRLRRAGIQRTVMVTGDRIEAAEMVGAMIGVDEVLAERTPAEKVEAVKLERRGGPTIMVGDGINDAPALAAADVGVAIGARGATASSEAADVVLTVDHLDRLAEAVVIARRAQAIATQSVVVGIGLSVAAMVVAALGFLPATWGAVTQEAIDVAVILNALRALGASPDELHLNAADAVLTQRFSTEHVALRSDVEQIRVAADAIGVVPPLEALSLARDVYRLLTDDILPHEQAEDTQLYPIVAKALGGKDPTATMSRAHLEIAHQARRLGATLDGTDPAKPEDDDLTDLRRRLYGLHAILRLHFAQEDESYLSLADGAEPVAAALRTQG